MKGKDYISHSRVITWNMPTLLCQVTSCCGVDLSHGIDKGPCLTNLSQTRRGVETGYGAGTEAKPMDHHHHDPGLGQQ